MPFVGIGIGVGKGGSRSVPTFEFTINTANTSTGSSTSTQFKLPLITSTGLDCTVDWGDGNTDNITSHTQAEVTHTYASSGVYTVKITGSLLGWRFNNGGDRLKILDVKKWSGLNISVNQGFYGCNNLTASATDAPVISTTSLNNYFRGCTNFNGAIGNWDVSNITDMSLALHTCPAFNQNIGSWNVSNVRFFTAMFTSSSSFNNGGSDSIKNWNISNTILNISMLEMFTGASSFNQPIGSWNVSNVVSMRIMFRNAIAFNQDIGNWDVSNVTDFTGFMQSKTAANYSAANLDSIYNNWSQLSVQPNLTIDFGTIKYNASAQASKDILTSAPNNWTCIDGGVV